MRVSTGYWPRPHQAEVHRALRRFNVLVCHRRFGKTVLCINHLIDRALRLAAAKVKRPRLAYIAPFYRQAKAVAWDYLKAYTASIPGRSINEAELRVDLPGGARIALYGADNPDSLRGLYLDWVVLDEYAQMAPSLWGEVIRPALSDRQGGAIFIGTPKGRNAFYDLFVGARDGWPEQDGVRVKDQDWLAMMYRASETNIVPVAEIESARRTQTPEQYEQEYECSFDAAILGAYYGKEMARADAEGRITRVPWEPDKKVHTCWDLGGGINMAIWFFQLVNREVRWIDFDQSGGDGLPHYAKVLASKPYTYGDHLWPHDGGVKEIGTGVSREETAHSLGLRPKICPRQAVQDGINAVRLLLPRSYFDAVKCDRGIEALRQYRCEFDEKRGVLRPEPLHDWASHPADAMRTGAMNLPASDDNWGEMPSANRAWVR